MKTVFTLLAIFTIFYFASSCKKGDTSNVVPPYDSTHYNDSVKHVADSILHLTDSIKHYTDSVYKIPYGVYRGVDVYNGWFNGDTQYSNDERECTVAKLAGDSIEFQLPRGETIDFKFDSSGQYLYQNGSYIYESFKAYIGHGSLSLELKESDPDDHTSENFDGMKKL